MRNHRSHAAAALLALATATGAAAAGTGEVAATIGTPSPKDADGQTAGTSEIEAATGAGSPPRNATGPEKIAATTDPGAPPTAIGNSEITVTTGADIPTPDGTAALTSSPSGTGTQAATGAETLLPNDAGTTQPAAKAIPGLASATLLPGWITPSGSRMVALDLQLQPGWKTYWRAPGDEGIPPQFDWTGSTNLGPVTFHWPAPKVIDSGGSHTLGFHERLILPIEITPAAAGSAPALNVAVDFGLCREVCVPAHVTLTAPEAGAAPDPLIEAALNSVPLRLPGRASCNVTPIADGLRVTAAVSHDAGPDPDAALELISPPGEGPVWVSEAEVRVDGPTVTATADFVPPSGAPFEMDPAQLRLTLIDAQGRAVEVEGCAG